MTLTITTLSKQSLSGAKIRSDEAFPEFDHSNVIVKNKMNKDKENKLKQTKLFGNKQQVNNSAQFPSIIDILHSLWHFSKYYVFLRGTYLRTFCGGNVKFVQIFISIKYKFIVVINKQKVCVFSRRLLYGTRYRLTNCRPAQVRRKRKNDFICLLWLESLIRKRFQKLLPNEEGARVFPKPNDELLLFSYK